jgi:branched-chain amino acid transport system permease protein
VNKGRNPLFLIIVLAAVFLFPFSGNMHWTRVLIEIFMWTTVSLGFRLILMAGQINLAQIAFMGLGAYTVAILTTKLSLNYWLCLPVAVASTAWFAFLIGYISLRTKGIHFALATFAVAEVIRLIWIEWKTLFGGVGGIPNIPPPDSILGLAFTNVAAYYYFAFLMALFTIAVMHRIDRSRFGAALLTFEHTEDLAQSVGIDCFRYKNIAFVIGSAFAGLAGGFFATFYHYVGSEDFTIHQTFYVMIYVLTGGVQSIFGTILGVASLMIALKLIHHIPGFNPVWEPLFLGCTLLAVMKFLPGGLISLRRSASGEQQQWEERPGGEVA